MIPRQLRSFREAGVELVAESLTHKSARTVEDYVSDMIRTPAWLQRRRRLEKNFDLFTKSLHHHELHVRHAILGGHLHEPLAHD